MQLLRLLAGYTLYGHKRNEKIPQELGMHLIMVTVSHYQNNWQHQAGAYYECLTTQCSITIGVPTTTACS